MKRTTRRGVTLIELLVVFIIIAFLCAILYPAIKSAQSGAKKSAFLNTEVGKQWTCENRLATIRDAKTALQRRYGVSNTFVPTYKELLPFVYRKKLSEIESCPAEGKYTIGNMATLPTCNYVHTIRGVVLSHKIEKKPIPKRVEPNPDVGWGDGRG